MLNTIIIALSTGSVFLLAFISFQNPGKANVIANRWLGGFLFCFGLALLADLFYSLAVDREYSLLIVFSEITRFAIAPTLYLSVSYFCSADNAFRKKDFLHFIPALLFLVNCSPAFLPGHSQLLLLNKLANFTGATESIPIFMFLVIKAQVIIYWILSYVKLTRHQKNVKLVFSSIVPVDLSWLKYFMLGVLFIVLIWFNEAFFHIQEITNYSSLGYLLAIYFISYFALRQKEVYPFTNTEISSINEIISEANHKAQQQERISADKTQVLKMKLKQLMETEKYFHDPGLGLPQLAEKMELSPHELSYLLNKGFGVSFFEFVNSYRVEEAKWLLLSDKHQHLNMLGIAYEAGFNSKTTFNIAFKKSTGQSPTEFRKHRGESSLSSISDPLIS